MGLYLGVDGGGTGCRAVVADAGGRLLGRGVAGPANVWTDPEGARASILRAAKSALGGLRAESAVAVLGLAGANLPGAAARLGALPFAAVRVESDAVTALKGALGEADGVVAALGTGSVFAAQRAGGVRVIGGWGFQLGDQGGGARLGRAMMAAALRGHDGLGPATPLTTALLAEAGGPAGLVEQAQRAAPGDFARLAPRIVAAAAAGDAAAEAVLAEAAAAVDAAITHLMAGAAMPLCFLGGLGPVYTERLAARYGGLIREPAGDALDGALMMARGWGEGRGNIEVRAAQRGTGPVRPNRVGPGVPPSAAWEE